MIVRRASSRRRLISRLVAAAPPSRRRPRPSRARASYSRARKTSATLRKAVSTVDRYCASACSRPACAARFLAARAPPVKGWSASGWRHAARAGQARPEQRIHAFSDSVLTPALRVICGNWLAVATPTRSACRVELASELRARRAALLDQLRTAGRLERAARSAPPTTQVGERELLGQRIRWAAARSGWRADLRCRARYASCKGGKVASAWATAACWAATSTPAIAPSPDWRCRMPSVSRWAAMMRCVASTWPRSRPPGSPPPRRWRRATGRRPRAGSIAPRPAPRAIRSAGDWPPTGRARR